MAGSWRRIWLDLKDRRHVDTYAVAFVAFCLAVLSVVGDIVPDQIRWAAILAGVGLIVLRDAVPVSNPTDINEVFQDRFAFDKKSLGERLKSATEVWIYAPSAVNLLTAQSCELLRTTCLATAEGSVRVVVLDPREEASVRLAAHQLDDSLDYPLQYFSESLLSTESRLRTMSSWNVNGDFEYRLLDYNPGFSLVGINPSKRNGYFIVEFHGFHNESTSSRMHFEITRQDSLHWFEYWFDQFTRIWDSAGHPAATGS